MIRNGLRLSCLATAFAVVAAGSAYATTAIVGGFDAARGGFESLAPGEDSALASDIATAYPGTTFQFTGTLTPSFLSGVNVVILGVATTDFSAITPLSASEQSALYNFVLHGGTALIFSDNSTFDSMDNAPAANASLVSPFGVTTTGTLNGLIDAPIIDSTGPLTGPFTPVTEFEGDYTGYYSDTNGGQVLADWYGNPAYPAIDYFKPTFFGPHSGAVVLFSDSDAMVAGDALTTTNLNLVLNAFATYQSAPVPEPSTWATMLIGFGLCYTAFRRGRGRVSTA
jgi:PEP-CTERM motif-containing protein